MLAGHGCLRTLMFCAFLSVATSRIGLDYFRLLLPLPIFWWLHCHLLVGYNLIYLHCRLVPLCAGMCGIRDRHIRELPSAR